MRGVLSGSERSLVERREVRIGHHHRDGVDRQAQFVGDACASEVRVF